MYEQKIELKFLSGINPTEFTPHTSDNSYFDDVDVINPIKAAMIGGTVLVGTGVCLKLSLLPEASTIKTFDTSDCEDSNWQEVCRADCLQNFAGNSTLVGECIAKNCSATEGN